VILRMRGMKCMIQGTQLIEGSEEGAKEHYSRARKPLRREDLDTLKLGMSSLVDTLEGIH